MKIKIENCNNVKEGEISICPNTLNIKYALNGTGKSTIVNALIAAVEKNDAKLKKLIPFSVIAAQGADTPKVFGFEEIQNVRAFNEAYVDSYLFTKDDLLKNSFQVLIKTDKYADQVEEIGRRLQAIKDAFKDDKELELLISAFQVFLSDYGKAKKLSKNSGISKGLAKGNKLRNIPVGLDAFKDFLRGDKPAEWLDWHSKGNSYGKLSERCPYCTNGITEARPMIDKLDAEYNPEEIRYLSETIKTFSQFLSYFSESAKETLKGIIENAGGITKDQEKFLAGLRDQVSGLQEQFLNLRFIKFGTFNEVDQIENTLKDMQIDVSKYSCLNPEMVIDKVERINKSVDVLLGEVGELKGKIKQHQIYVQELVKKYEGQMNTFLTKAGFKYEVAIVERRIEGEAENEYRMVIRHKAMKEEDDGIKKVEEHLSFGERNAFALALFMFDAVASNADLVVLDDPVSSFDGEKKFALLDMLFWGKAGECLKGKTVLMLTHDFAPVIDVIKTMRSKFPNHVPVAHYLVNHSGVVTEKDISKDDICSARSIARQAISDTGIDILRLVYLRRLIEIDDKIGNAKDAYNMISSVVKRRKVPTVGPEENSPVMSDEERHNAEEYIKGFVGDFTYERYLAMAQDTSSLLAAYASSTSNYEKLQIFRIVHGVDKTNGVIRKFVNESYHIENDYLFSLSPIRFETVPQYVIDALDYELRKDGLL